MKQNDAAVSPVIGIILMVAITVILATVIAAIVYSFSADRQNERPTCAIKVDSIYDTHEIIDLKIVHSGGDRLVSGQWRISIVPAGNSPVYRESSTDFNVGDQIITTNLTSGTGNYTVTNSAVFSDVPSEKLISNGKYAVMIIVLPYRAVVLDTIILAR